MIRYADILTPAERDLARRLVADIEPAPPEPEKPKRRHRRREGEPEGPRGRPPLPAVDGKKPWEAAGVSRATWYRMQGSKP